MKVEIWRSSDEVKLPVLGSKDAAAADIHAYIVGGIDCINYSVNVECGSNNEVSITPGGRALIPTGIHISIPKGYEIEVRPRSGLALKHGISIVNSPGTIDSDYRGQIGIILINHGLEAFNVKNGDRIAQLALRKTEVIEWDDVDEYSILDKTDRGEDGFGSSGK